MTIFTIGYEGLSLSEFKSLLAQNRIHFVVDVRALPLSRKRGFSKSILEAWLAQFNYRYLHIRNLGCPQTIRYQYKKDRHWECYASRFRAYLETQNEAISQLTKLIKQSNCVLLCYEADANFCHRSLVADKIRALSDTNVIHLNREAKTVEKLFRAEMAVI